MDPAGSRASWRSGNDEVPRPCREGARPRDWAAWVSAGSFPTRVRRRSTSPTLCAAHSASCLKRFSPQQPVDGDHTQDRRRRGDPPPRRLGEPDEEQFRPRSRRLIIGYWGRRGNFSNSCAKAAQLFVSSPARPTAALAPTRSHGPRSAPPRRPSRMPGNDSRAVGGRSSRRPPVRISGRAWNAARSAVRSSRDSRQMSSLASTAIG